MRRTLTMLLATVMLAGCTATGNAPVDPEQVAAEADHVVQYTADGFDPQRITIEEGETVAWISKGPAMWIASNSHPTHADYGLDADADPVFDQRERGVVYTFQFNRTGEWQYHDHLHAHHHGTVEVEPAHSDDGHTHGGHDHAH